MRKDKSHIIVFLDSYMHLRSCSEAAGRLVVSVLQHPLLAGDVCYTACTRFDWSILFLPLLYSLQLHLSRGGKKVEQMCWHEKKMLSFYKDGGGSNITPLPLHTVCDDRRTLFSWSWSHTIQQATITFHSDLLELKMHLKLATCINNKKSHRLWEEMWRTGQHLVLILLEVSPTEPLFHADRLTELQEVNSARKNKSSSRGGGGVRWRWGEGVKWGEGCKVGEGANWNASNPFRNYFPCF